MIRFGTVIALAVSLLVALPGLGSAQAEGTQVRPQNRPTREEMIARAEQIFYDQMAQELRLTPEQTTALRAIFAEYEQPRREIAAQKRRLIGEAHSFRTRPGTEERARTLLDEFERIREREATLLREEEDKLLEVLAPSQVLALQIFREQAGDRIRGATNPFQNPNGSGAGFGGGSPFRTSPSR